MTRYQKRVINRSLIISCHWHCPIMTIINTITTIPFFFEDWTSWSVSFSFKRSHPILSWHFPEYVLRRYVYACIKSVAYSSQESQTGQLDFCNGLADGNVYVLNLWLTAPKRAKPVKLDFCNWLADGHVYVLNLWLTAPKRAKPVN